MLGGICEWFWSIAPQFSKGKSGMNLNEDKIVA